MLKADQLHDEIMALCADIEQPVLETRDDVERFVRSFTKLTYDYCMFGLLYDYYLYDVEVLRENAVHLRGGRARNCGPASPFGGIPGFKDQD